MIPSSLALLLALASAADLPPALVVRAPGDAGPRLAAALSARLPTVRVVEGAEPGFEDLVVALDPDRQGSWDLSVARAGARALQRSMAAGASGPDAAFFVACAAVIERYLQGIEWKGRPPAIDPDAVAQPPPAAPPPPLGDEPAPVEEPAGPIVWSLGVGGSGAAGFQNASWRAGPALDFSGRRSLLFGALRAQVYVPDTHAISVSRPGRAAQTGEVQDLAASGSILGGTCWGETLSLCGGLQLGWRGTWAWGESSDLFQWQTAHSDAFLAGLFAMASLKLPARLELRALVTGSSFWGERGFFVEGVEDAVLSPPRYEVGLALELARAVP